MAIGTHHPIPATVDLTDVQLFVAVAKQQSFVGASRKTGVPTSTVSRAVARLEEALGQRLLHRTSRKVVATQEGAWLLERALPLVDELRGLLEDVQERNDEPSGRLRVTAPVMTGAERIGPALIAFAAAHPQLELELRLTNAVLNLRDEGIDLAFRAGPVTDLDVVARKLWSAPFALAASPAFVKKRLGGRKRLSAAKLAELPAVVTQSGAVWRFLGEGGKPAVLVPQPHFSANDPRVAVAAAKAGLGVVRAPRELIDREGQGLVLLECELGELEGRDMFAVYPSRRLLPARVKAAIEWVRKAPQG
jgi:LysR family transcriptional regulator, transcriptional activator AphB